MYFNRQAFYAKGIVCKGVLVVVKLNGFKVGMLF